jgi:hypothetical protein
MNAMLRTALKRKKARKLAQDYMNAMLRTALKTHELSDSERVDWFTHLEPAI